MVRLGVMEGLNGLEKVFGEEFPHGKVQDCQVRVASNILAKVPGNVKKAAADYLRSIFCTSSRKKADEFAMAFAPKWEKNMPSTVKCLSNFFDPHLASFSFPEKEAVTLRTTNTIQRLNNVHEKDKSDGDRRRGKRLLSSSGVHITEDGDELEDKESRKGTSELPLYRKFTQLG